MADNSANAALAAIAAATSAQVPNSIPLGLEAYSKDASCFPQVELINMYLEDDHSGVSFDKKLRQQRPGMALFNTATTGNIRGFFQQDGIANGTTFVVAGNQVQTMTSTAVVTLGGTVDHIVDDGKPASFAAAFQGLAIASGGMLYFYQDGALSQIDIPDAETDQNRRALDITSVNNFIIVANPDGHFFWVNPGETTIDPLNFSTAESAADGLVACRALGDDLYLFGSATVEVWQNNPNSDDATISSFLRAPGRNFNRGCLHHNTVAKLDNTLVWVGDNYVVYRVSDSPERISTFAIEEHISKRTGDPSAMVYQIDAHEFYCLKIPGRGTFAYDAATKSWSQLQSTGYTEFRPAFALQSGSRTLLGDALSGKVWQFDRTRGDDDGTVMLRLVTGSTPLLSRRPTRNDSISLFVGSSAKCNYRLRYHDGQNSYPVAYRKLPARAGSDILTYYRLGAGTESYRTFEISITDNVVVRISGLVANKAFD